MALDPVTAVLEIGGKLIDRMWPDPVQKAAAQFELLKLNQAGELQIIGAQLEINKIEASNPSVFVSGWRPAVGWVCVTACAWNWLGLSMLNTMLQVTHSLVQLKAADTSEMMPILMALLGIGGYRTIEKLQGKA